MDILQACDLKKTYGTGEACVHALDGVSLNVEKRLHSADNQRNKEQAR